MFDVRDCANDWRIVGSGFETIKEARDWRNGYATAKGKTENPDIYYPVTENAPFEVCVYRDLSDNTEKTLVTKEGHSFSGAYLKAIEELAFKLSSGEFIRVLTPLLDLPRGDLKALYEYCNGTLPCYLVSDPDKGK